MERNNDCPIKEGDIITLECESIGTKGDGIFKVDGGLVVIVPNTEVGSTYKIKITAVRNKVSFGEICNE